MKPGVTRMVHGVYGDGALNDDVAGGPVARRVLEAAMNLAKALLPAHVFNSILHHVAPGILFFQVKGGARLRFGSVCRSMKAKSSEARLVVTPLFCPSSRIQTCEA